MARKKEVTPARVREVLKELGVEVGARGRFSAEQLEAFHKAQPREVYAVGKQEGRKITGVRVNPETGRKTPVTVVDTVSNVRAWALSEGLAVGSRGRITPDVLAAFAAAPRV